MFIEININGKRAESLLKLNVERYGTEIFKAYAETEYYRIKHQEYLAILDEINRRMMYDNGV